MFKSPRRNGRNKGLKIKHVIQISLLLGVSVWLLYQIHHSDDKKPSATINVSHKLNNDSSKDINKLGRKVLRPKVKETKEQHRVDDEQNNESEGSEDVEDHESDEHEEVGVNEHADGKEDSEEIKEHENDEGIKGKLNVNTSNEQNRAVVMDNIEKDVSPSEDGGGDRNRNEQNSKEQTAQQIGFAPDSYSNETDTAQYVNPTGNEKNMKGESYSGAQSKKDDAPILEEEKDAFTELETLPENVTGVSVSLENAATE